MKTIHHVIDIDAATPTVWAAITEQDRLSGWWSTEVDAPDARVGTRVTWTFAGDFNPVMEITESQSEHRLSWQCISGHANWKDNEFVFELARPAEGRTRMRFWQHYATELSDDDYGIYNFNWGYYMESLRLLCVTGSGKPFRPGG